VLTTLPQLLTVFQDYETLLLGFAIMLVMVFLRRGIVPSLAALIPRRARA
jgi:branched-chain amino acid transport system permease protein